MTSPPVTVFASASGNAFMTDIAQWLVDAAVEAGRTATLVTDRLPAPDGSINLVVAPHEMFGLFQASDDELRAAIACSVPVCTEQPNTPWFDLTAELVAGAACVLDINRHGVAALRARGIDAAHLQLGGVASMAAPPVERDIDVLFLGGATPRRNAQLASLAPILWDRASELRLFRFSAPVGEHVPGVVFGADKYALLARSRILLNIHRDDVQPGYFEWARMVEAMVNGCAVVTEPSTGFEPLVEGVHFIATHDVAGALDELLDDRQRCAAIGEAARAAVCEAQPLAHALGPALEWAARHTGAGTATTSRRPLARTHRPPVLPEFRPHTDLRRRVYAAWMKELQLARRIDRARCLVQHGSDDVVVPVENDAYADARPEVSVVVTLYDYARLVTETLDSIVASTDVAFEVIVVDDHSHDDGRAVVEAFMQSHRSVPMLLLGSEVNRGLSESRNLGIAAARAPLVMIMDADNAVYPNCLARLRDALGADPGAAFAYATLEAFGADPGLRSELGWYPRWLCEVNYIDAQAMIRRAAFDRHGGYRDVDDFTYGWEDWALWLRFAAAGERGVHVPQMLGRYRTQASSMVSITNLVADELRARIVAQFPSLPWPELDSAATQSSAPVVTAEEHALAARLSAARRRQDHMQRPVGIVLDAWARLRSGLRRLLR